MRVLWLDNPLNLPGHVRQVEGGRLAGTKASLYCAAFSHTLSFHPITWTATSPTGRPILALLPLQLIRALDRLDHCRSMIRPFIQTWRSLSILKLLRIQSRSALMSLYGVIGDNLVGPHMTKFDLVNNCVRQFPSTQFYFYI